MMYSISVLLCKLQSVRMHIITHQTVKRKMRQVIFMTIVAVVVIVLALMIVTGVIRKKRASQVRSVNVSQEPLTVDFQSIQDADMEPISPDSTQQITTQGQDIQEIALDAAPGAMIIG